MGRRRGVNRVAVLPGDEQIADDMFALDGHELFDTAASQKYPAKRQEQTWV